MCGRYTLTYADLGAVAEEIGALLDPAALAIHRPRYNIAPANAAVIARGAGGGTRLVPATWGLRLGGRFVINVRSESAAARLPEAFAHGRAVVPADGFYEWTGDKADRRPNWFHDPAGRPLYMAALVMDMPSAPPAFAVLTTAARAPVDAVHDRMPALFTAADARRWIAEADRAISPSAVSLVATPVSQRVNGTAHDDPACIAPEAPGPRGQLRLF